MKSNRMRRNIIIVLAILVLLAPAATVSAVGKPFHFQVPFAASTVSGACDFDVYWEPLVDNGYLTIITDHDATRNLITGTLKARLTNLETGKFIDRNISAQMIQTVYGDGAFTVEAHGPLIGWFGYPGNPPLAYVKGQQMVKYDAEGNLTEAVQSGHVEDLCVTLAN